MTSPALCAIVAEVKVAPWVSFYLKTMRLFCDTFGVVPDENKVASFLVRYGIRITINGRRGRP